MSDDIPLRTPSYRVERSRGMDAATRRLVFIAAGLGGALLVLIGAWSMTGGGNSSGSGVVPVIAPPSGPLRVKPANPGGMKVTGADQSIFDHSTDGRDAAQGSLMPAPERPDLQALRAPAPARPAAPGGSDAAPGGAAGSGPSAAPGATPESAGAPPAQAASGLPLPPAFPAASPAALTSATAPAGSPTPGTSGTAVPRLAPTTATPAARPAESGGTEVQLAALPTRAAAEAEWEALRRRLPGLLAGRQLVLAEARVGGRLWWRVRTAGFAGPAEARRFCAQARAAGTACDVTPF